MTEHKLVDNIYARELSDKSHHVYRGWDEELARDLVERSQEDAILQWTPKDASRRFSDMTAAREWYNSSERTIYSLRGEELEGIIWYTRQRRIDIDAEFTFAIRLYETARGKKLAHGFMQAAHVDFIDQYGDVNIWLETDTENSTARHLYEKFGYDVVEEKADRVTMVYMTEKA